MTKNNRGLGKGIGAFFPELDELAHSEIALGEVIEVPLTDLRPNPYQPRKTFDEQSLEELAQSIKKSGVFQPIIIRKSEIKGYEIIAGERRYRASKLAGKATIPAIIRSFDEGMMMQVAVLENLQREDLNPLEEAEAYKMLMENLSLTQAELSESLGKSRPYIANYLRLLTLPTIVKEELKKERLSMGQARTLLSLKDKKQITILANRAIKENLTVRQLEQIVAKSTKKPKVNVTQPVSQPYYIKASEEKLTDKFKTAVKIQDQGAKGKIEIEYFSSDDLTRILDILAIKFDD